ncbi:hypothetical protein [Halolamina sp. C58]|uniref:DUF7860 family protein n=1 Tax=Halolamina sp. C58 TaxID=3421640 RepID=UPI003EC03C89
MGRYGNIDYPLFIKRGVLLGLALMFVGELGGFLSENYISLPAWEGSLFLLLAGIGLLLFATTPILFGIVLPLTE